jgi:hypothetical protein
VVELHAFPTAVLYEGEWSCSYCGHKRYLSIQWGGGLFGPISVLDAVSKREAPCPCKGSNSGLQSRHLVYSFCRMFSRFSLRGRHVFFFHFLIKTLIVDICHHMCYSPNNSFGNGAFGRAHIIQSVTLLLCADGTFHYNYL